MSLRVRKSSGGDNLSEGSMPLELRQRSSRRLEDNTGLWAQRGRRRPREPRPTLGSRNAPCLVAASAALSCAARVCFLVAAALGSATPLAAQPDPKIQISVQRAGPSTVVFGIDLRQLTERPFLSSVTLRAKFFRGKDNIGEALYSYRDWELPRLERGEYYALALPHEHGEADRVVGALEGALAGGKADVIGVERQASGRVDPKITPSWPKPLRPGNARRGRGDHPPFARGTVVQRSAVATALPPIIAIARALDPESQRAIQLAKESMAAQRWSEAELVLLRDLERHPTTNGAQRAVLLDQLAVLMDRRAADYRRLAAEARRGG